RWRLQRPVAWGSTSASDRPGGRCRPLHGAAMTRPFHRALLALVVALAAAGLLAILLQPRASRLSSDFTINYSAGVLVRQGPLAAPYQQAALGDTMRRVAPDGA